MNASTSFPSSPLPVTSWSPGADAPAGGLLRWTPNRFREAGEAMRDSPGPDLDDARRTFHRSLPGYAVTPMHDLPALAETLGVARVAVKDESSRLGLPAFKMLGASWAVYRCLAELCPDRPEPTLQALAECAAGLPPISLVTATDGNHGRAVARMAAYLGLPATVLIPDVVSPEAIDLVRSEGADVEVLPLTYDETVAEAARRADQGTGGTTSLLVQDTSWPGYETVPRWIVDGYATLFDEAAEQLDGVPALMVVPAGVGSLAHAAVLHCRRHPGWRAVTVEPDVAPCIAASLAAGAAVSTGTGETTMAGLNCGTPSTLAFPDLLSILEGGVWVTDDEAAEATAALAERGIDAGACGSASLAALQHLAGASELTRDMTVLLLNTEATR
ncbi:MAG TPA: pyridoxal-phosphate dependent enzyme [Marmoricola sp.]|nr:pyridoxal-phosphate dependent enzyme [Marmoricola sp.]